MSNEKRPWLFLLVLALISFLQRNNFSSLHDLFNFGIWLFTILVFLFFLLINVPRIVKWATKPKHNFEFITRSIQFIFGGWAIISFVYQGWMFVDNFLHPEALKDIIQSGKPPDKIDDLKNLLDIHVALINVLISLLATNYLAMKRMEGLPDQVQDVKDSADKVSNYAANNSAHALNIVEKLLDIKKFSDARNEDFHKSSTFSLAAIACNLMNWENHVRFHTKPPNKSPVLIEVWLRSQAAYFLEEGYEIGRKSMATNGRNFCFLLLATLDSFIEHAKRNYEKVCYVAVTPVSPEDWYNWPHGYGSEIKHFENDFVGDFHRVLREFLSQENNSISLEHSRYLLIAKDKPDDKHDKPKQFGWELSHEKTFKENIKGWTVPVSIKLHDLTVSFTESKGKSLNQYATELHKYFFETRKLKNISDNDNIYVTPAFCTKWDNNNTEIAAQPPEEVVDGFITGACSNHWNAALTIIDKLTIESNKRKSEPTHNSELERILEESLKNAKKIHNVNGRNTYTFLDWLRDSHSVEANLAAVASGCAQEFQRLRYHLLRFRDRHHYDQRKNDLNGDLSIGNVFATFLHSKPENCFVAPLSHDKLEELKNDKIQPEFHLFGTRENTSDEPKWQLLVTTLLDYPFEVTRITMNDNPIDPLFIKHKRFLDEMSGNTKTTIVKSEPLMNYYKK